MNETHYGTNGLALCGQSKLLGGSTTSDLEAVACIGCLWALWANGLGAIDKIANRLRVVTNERIIGLTGGKR